jgi:hypothetical protein
MRLKDARETYYFHTGKVSDIVRQLSLAALAIIWLFRVSEGPAANRIPHELVLPSMLIVTALALDLMQYAWASAAWGTFQRRKEKEVTEDAEFRASDWLNAPTVCLFVVKTIATVAAYGMLLHFLWGTVLPHDAAQHQIPTIGPQP